MHRFHLLLPSSFFLIIFSLLVSQPPGSTATNKYGSFIYPPSAPNGIFPDYNYLDIVNVSWSTSMPEPDTLLIWCSTQGHYFTVYNQTVRGGNANRVIQVDFEGRAYELCHFAMVSTMNSSGSYLYGFNGPNFHILKTGATEPVTWGESTPGVSSTSLIPIEASSSSSSSSATYESCTPSCNPSSSITFSPPPPPSSPSFSPSSSSSSSSSSVVNSLATPTPAAPSGNTTIASPLSSPLSTPPSQTLSPSAQAVIGVGIVVCLGLILAIIATFFYKRHRRFHHHHHQQQHQGLSPRGGRCGGGKARHRINERKQIFRSRGKLTELAAEEVANELEGG